MVHQTREDTFDKVRKIAEELRTYKRQHKWELLQRFALIACIIVLLLAIVTGFDATIRAAINEFFKGDKALAK